MAINAPGGSPGNFNKPALSFTQIWNMCFGFLGIQFGWALQMANMSAIFEHLGATQVAGLWLAAPLTGLIVQPIIGYISDKTWHPRFGRRRPFFLIGAILSSIALILMPNSSTLWMAAGLLWVLDASINISMEPFRAFVADKLPERQRTLGFTTQSFFIGVGAVLASMMPYILTNWFKVQNEAEGNSIPTSVKFSFYIGAAVFFTAVLYTILTSKEYPPDDLGHAEKTKENKKGFAGGVREIFSSIAHLPKIMRQLAPVQFFTWMGLFCMWIFFGVTIARSVFEYKDTTLKTDLVFESTKAAAHERLKQVSDITSDDYKKNRKELNRYFNNKDIAYPAFLQMSLDSLMDNIPSFAATAEGDDFKKINNKISDNNKDPKTDKIDLAMLVSEQKKAGIASGAFIDEYRTNKKRYNDGVEWGGNCFAFYSLVTFLFAFFLPLIANRIGKKKAHILCLVIGGIGLLSIWIIKDKYALFGTMTCVGIAWTSILSMPYAMLSNRIPSEKMGIYMGIFNFFIVIPEIITALSFDWVLENVYDWNRTIFVATGGILMLLAALLCFRVTESD
jgi:maltose/moltooligosaccharide transporter